MSFDLTPLNVWVAKDGGEWNYLLACDGESWWCR